MAVGGGHRAQFVQGADLLVELLPVADHRVGGERVVQRAEFGLLGLDEAVHPVQGDAAVVADDAASAVGVGQAGDHTRAAGGPDLRGVGVEDAVVVGLPVFGEDLLHLRVELVAVGGQAVLHHPQPALGHDRPLERRVGLQPHDQLAVAVDVAGGVRGDRRGRGGVDVVDAPPPLLGKHPGDPVPHGLGPGVGPARNPSSPVYGV